MAAKDGNLLKLLALILVGHTDRIHFPREILRIMLNKAMTETRLPAHMQSRENPQQISPNLSRKGRQSRSLRDRREILIYQQLRHKNPETGCTPLMKFQDSIHSRESSHHFVIRQDSFDSLSSSHHFVIRQDSFDALDSSHSLRNTTRLH